MGPVLKKCEVKCRFYQTPCSLLVLNHPKVPEGPLTGRLQHLHFEGKGSEGFHIWVEGEG
jgi:hypothetical protein